MSLTVSQMRSLVVKPLGVEVGDEGFTEGDIDQLLNLALWEISDMYDFRAKDQEYSFDTVIGIRDYAMPSPYEGLKVISIFDTDDNKRIRLMLMTEDTYFDTYDSDTDSESMPTHYYRHGDNVRLYPTPNAVYTIELVYDVTISDLSDSNTTTGLPRNWDEIVVAGAIYRGYKNLGDWVRANAALADQEQLMGKRTPTQAKEQHDSRAGLRVLGYRRGVKNQKIDQRYNKF